MAKAKHEGVWIVWKKSKNAYIARWRDPLTNKRVEVNLGTRKQGYCKSKEACEAWAVRKAKELQKLAKREGGAPVAIVDAVNDYFKTQLDLRENTVNAYRYALGHLTAWATKEGLSNCDQLTPGGLARLRNYIGAIPRRVVQPGQTRGARKASAARLSPASRNQILRGVHTFLGHIRRMDYTPELDSDDINDRLGYFKGEKHLIVFLRHREIAMLLAAAERHDAETWKATKVERELGKQRLSRVGREQGTTPRYDPIRPFILACLLMGGRFQEVAGLRWDEIDLDVGEIRLDPKRVKTKAERLVLLKTSPMLWEMLNTMKLQAGGNTHVFTTWTWRWRDKRKVRELTQGMTRDLAESARHRLIRAPKQGKSQRPITNFGAPEFTWHDLRRTCGTYLVNMPGANLKHVADYLGHETSMAEKLYWGRVEIDPRATTLEQAMGIAPLPDAASAATPILRTVGA